MNDRTEVIDIADVIRVRRPDGCTDEQWAEIKRVTVEHLDHITARVTGRCVELDWCTAVDADGHDAGWHRGETIGLADYDPEEITGWWCWPTWDDSTANGPAITLEGQASKDDDVVNVDIPVSHLSYVLEATSTPEARATLVELLGRVSS